MDYTMNDYFTNDNEYEDLPAVESFIDFCDEYQIAEEGFVEIGKKIIEACYRFILSILGLFIRIIPVKSVRDKLLKIQKTAKMKSRMRANGYSREDAKKDAEFLVSVLDDIKPINKQFRKELMKSGLDYRKIEKACNNYADNLDNYCNENPDKAYDEKTVKYSNAVRNNMSLHALPFQVVGKDFDDFDDDIFDDDDMW